MKKILFYFDIIILTLIIIILISTFFIPFYANLVAVITGIIIYEIINFIKIIAILLYFKIKKLNKSDFVKIWLRLSIAALVVLVIYFSLVFWSFSHGA